MIKAKVLLVASFIFTLVVVASDCDAITAVYDLASDWSDTSNPNPPWAYGTLSATGEFTPFPIHTNSYINVGPPAFSGDQPVWTNQLLTGDNGSPEGLAKSVGIGLFDFPAGRVGGHTPLNGSLAIRWTAPQTGSASLAGDVWMWRDIGRHEALGLFVDDTALFSGVPIPTRASGTTSANPFLLSDAISAGGGSPAQLADIPVNAGDTITLAALSGRFFGDTEDFVGFDFTVRLTTVPEPPAAGLFWTALFFLVVYGCVAHASSEAYCPRDTSPRRRGPSLLPRP